MIPLPQILAEFVMALGGALVVASVVALAKARFRPDATQVQARGKVIVNVFIGLVVFVWGLASFLTGFGKP